MRAPLRSTPWRECPTANANGQRERPVRKPLVHPHSRDLQTVNSYLRPAGADRLQQAFGAEELEVYREQESGPIRHAKIRLGDTIVEMGEAHGASTGPCRPGYITTCRMDAAYQRALSAGAKSISAPVELHHGERGAEIQDPDNSLFLATPLPGARN